jgi:hypothetical protein
MKFVLPVGVALLSASAFAYIQWFDTTSADRSASGYPISNRNDVDWAYANAGAAEVCKMWGFEAGLYVGHQSGQLMGVHCFSDDMIDWYDITNEELYSTPGWGNQRSVTDPPGEQIYFWSNRAAHLLCLGRGYGTGYFTGHQDTYNGVTGVNCIPSSRVGSVTVASNDPRFGFPAGFAGSPQYWFWYEANIAANDVCAYHGYTTGVMNEMWASGSAYYSHLTFHCWN